MYRFKPSKSAIIEFAKKMDEIDDFCKENNIIQSSTSDSYYFSINSIKFRISNHSIQQSNLKAFNDLGQRIRNDYHNSDDFYVEILASKTRLIDIYTSLINNVLIDYRGRIVDDESKAINTPHKLNIYKQITDSLNSRK